MSALFGKVKGRSHETTVSTSLGGIEIGIWSNNQGFGDSLTPQAARGLAALLERAADAYEAMIENKNAVR